MRKKNKLSRYDRLMGTARNLRYIADYDGIIPKWRKLAEGEDDPVKEIDIDKKLWRLCDKWNIPFPVKPFVKGKELQKKLRKSPAVTEVARDAGPSGNPVRVGICVNALSLEYIENEFEKKKDYDRFNDYFYIHLRIDATKNVKSEIWPQAKQIISEKLNGMESKPGRKPAEDIWEIFDKHGKDEISRSRIAKNLAGITGKVRYDSKYKNKWNRIDRAVKRANSVIKGIVPNPDKPN